MATILLNISKEHYRLSGIYSIVNILTGKIYIGSAVCLKKRYDVHVCGLLTNKHPNIKLKRAVSKYGIEHFSFNLVELCSKEDLISTEQKWIDYYNAATVGYNILPQAGSNLGFSISKESAQKIVAKRRANGWVVTDQQRQRMSESRRGKHHTAETKDKMKVAAKERMSNPDIKNKMIASKTNVKHTKEHNSQISQSLFAHYATIARNPGKGRKKYKTTGKKHNNAPIIAYSLTGNIAGEYVSACKAASALGVKRTSIGNCLNGLSKTVKTNIGKLTFAYKN